MIPGSSLSMAMSGRRVSRYVVAARCASWVHSSRGRVRAMRPSPICSISASDLKRRGRYSVIDRVLMEPDRRPGSSWCGLSLRLRLRLLWTRLSDALVDVRCELREIRDEQVDELRRRRVIFRRICPGAARIEQLAVDPRHFDRHVEPEVRILAELGVLQRTVEGGVEQGARFLDRHALADAIFAAG